MKQLLLCFFILSLMACQEGKNDPPPINQKIVSEDIAHFYEAIDAIQATKDSTEQLAALQKLFLDRASHGQQRMIDARRYSPEEYLNSINSNPQFWASLRNNTLDLSAFNEQLTSGANKLNKIYPEMEPATIYYTMGAHRSPGTGMDSVVLIGTEFALGDLNTVTTELRPHLQNYYKTNPVEHLDFLVVHEYVHTQQNDMEHNLLELALYEGIADFVAEKATGKKSPFDAFKYGPKNWDKIRTRFEEHMFNPNKIYNWLWNSPDNEFGTSELGYFVGHKISSALYKKAANKKEVIKQLVELDLSDQTKLYEMLDGTGLFSKPLAVLREEFEKTRPTIINIKGLPENLRAVDPSTREITLVFSEPMDVRSRGFDYGPMGERSLLRVEKVIGYSADKRQFKFEVKLEPGRRYQSTISSRFSSATGIPLKPFVIDFMTK